MHSYLALIRTKMQFCLARYSVSKLTAKAGLLAFAVSQPLFSFHVIFLRDANYVKTITHSQERNSASIPQRKLTGSQSHLHIQKKEALEISGRKEHFAKVKNVTPPLSALRRLLSPSFQKSHLNLGSK